MRTHLVAGNSPERISFTSVGREIPFCSAAAEVVSSSGIRAHHHLFALRDHGDGLGHHLINVVREALGTVLTRRGEVGSTRERVRYLLRLALRVLRNENRCTVDPRCHDSTRFI